MTVPVEDGINQTDQDSEPNRDGVTPTKSEYWTHHR